MHKVFFIFVRIFSLLSFIIVAASSDFSTASAFSFNFSVSILFLLIKESIRCCLISSLVSFLILLALSQFFFFSYKQKLTAIPQIFYIFYKQKALCELSFEIVLQGVHDHHFFCKAVFQINLINTKS